MLHFGQLPNNISFFDSHIGTLSNQVKVFNINSYTQNEAENNLVSEDLLPLIEKTLTLIPYKNYFNIEENLPDYINKIKSKITEETHRKWSNSINNNVDFFIRTMQ